MTTVARDDVEQYRLSARAWLAENLTRRAHRATLERDEHLMHEEERLAAHRVLQRRLFDAGYAGICFPREYGGQGLGPEYQRVFTEESVAYEMPVAFNVPTLGILAATILDFGTEAQKQRHLPAILRGDEYWIQFLSEPSGGSDVAGALTTAVRDGDEWVINGSKIWSTRAVHCDYALCLARTNWDVPKHRGLTVFIMQIRQPGVEVSRIRLVNGSEEFCQEFFTDVRVPADAVVGEVDEGWTVVTRWMFHERNAVGGGSPYVSGIGGDGAHGPTLQHHRLARARELLADPRVRELVAESYGYGVVQDQLIDRVNDGIAQGTMSEHAAAILRLYRGTTTVRQATIGMELAGETGVAWLPEDAAIGDAGVRYLMRQSACIGGGTTEIARNVISERVLGMPREPAPDRDRPFREARDDAARASARARARR
jgi:alkylation response protein AidB-like acyl-CoA dehydrogenase